MGNPALAAVVLRKVDFAGASSPSDLKRTLQQVLGESGRLQRHVNAVWTVAKCGTMGLPKERLPWAVEGLATQFDIKLDLEDRHMVAVQQRFDAFSKVHVGFLTESEF